MLNLLKFSVIDFHIPLSILGIVSLKSSSENLESSDVGAFPAFCFHLLIWGNFSLSSLLLLCGGWVEDLNLYSLQDNLGFGQISDGNYFSALCRLEICITGPVTPTVLKYDRLGPSPTVVDAFQ